MAKEYIVKQIKETSGMMFAVIHNDLFLFSKKKKKDAEFLAEKLNNIRERRLNNIV